MSTVEHLANRVQRDWLHAPDDQPVIVLLSGDVAADSATLPFDNSSLAPDEEYLFAPGVLAEVGRELVRIRSATSTILTVTRGVNGTEAVAHLAGAEITLTPTFSHAAVTEAVKDQVVALYPRLHQVATTEVTADSGYVEVPAEVITIDSFSALVGSRYQPRNVSLLRNFPASSTGKAIQFHGVASGTSGYLTYRARFGRPGADDTELADLGVEPEWERIVAVGAAAQVVAGRDLDALTAEYITEQLEREALPSDAPQRIRNGLLTLYNIWLEDASRGLRADNPVPVVMHV